MKRLGAAITAIALVACRQHNTHLDAPVKRHELARDASVVAGDATFLATEAGGSVELSRGDAVVVQTVAGTLAGVVDGRAYVLARRDGELEILEAGLDGPPTALGRIAWPGDRLLASVAAGGVVLVAADRTLQAVDAHGVRTLLTVADGERISTLAGDPDEPRAFVIARPEGPIGVPGPARLILLDVTTGAILDEGAGEAAPGAPAAFLGDGTIATILDSRYALLDAHLRTTGTGWYVNGYLGGPAVFSPSRHGVAFAYEYGNGEGSWSGPQCEVDYVDEQVLKRQDTTTVTTYEDGCGYGVGLAFVGDELWIAHHAPK